MECVFMRGEGGTCWGDTYGDEWSSDLRLFEKFRFLMFGKFLCCSIIIRLTLTVCSV